MPKSNTVLSVIGVHPIRIGAGEIWFRELSEQLGRHGWANVLCFESTPSQPVREFLQASNVTLEVLADSWQLKWRPTLELAKLLGRYRPRILHLHFTGFVSFYPWLAELYSAEKVFFTDQGSRPQGHVIQAAPGWKRAIIRLLNEPITQVICISDYSYQCNVGQKVLPAARYSLIYNSVNVARASRGIPAACSFRREHSIPDDRAIVVQVSWIIPEKGISDLLKAARLVLEKRPNVQFVVVGEGPCHSQYQQLAGELGIADHVTWTGLVQDPLAEGVYAAADVVCQMSRWEEAFGWVIAEAMATSKPLIGTKVGAIPELIEDGKTGFLVERGDSLAMADRILRLLEDQQLRQRMGEAGRAAAETKFELKKNVAQLMALYEIG